LANIRVILEKNSEPLAENAKKPCSTAAFELYQNLDNRKKQGGRSAATARGVRQRLRITVRIQLECTLVTTPTLPGGPGVERTIAWLNRCRRLAKDWENLNRKALAFLRLASIRLMLRKLCNPA
jgi:hypothetical protein